MLLLTLLALPLIGGGGGGIARAIAAVFFFFLSRNGIIWERWLVADLGGALFVVAF